MKDFYDIYFLSELLDFDGAILHSAISATLKHRGRMITEKHLEEIENYPEDADLKIRWDAFEPAKASGLLLSAAIQRIMDFLEPICISIIRDEDFSGRWDCRNAKWIESED